VSATYYAGGSTPLQGVDQRDWQETFRAGGTLTVPLGKRESLKFYGNSGAWSRTGSDFWLAGIALPISLGWGL
jgi:hypothetical protein